MKVSPLLVLSLRFIVWILTLNIGLSLVNHAIAQEQRPFQMEWNVKEGGSVIEFDLVAKNVFIDFGDGGSNYWDDISREGWLYGSPGNYMISISGGLESISLSPGTVNGNDFLRIAQWGDIQWKNVKDMFNGTQVQFNISQVDTPDLSQVTSMAGMFKDAQFDHNLGNWDISTITDMTDIFNGSTLSPQNYDATLIGWAAQEVQRNVVVGATGLVYCEGKEARQKLIDEYGWTFIGDTEFCEHLTKRPFTYTADVGDDLYYHGEGNHSVEVGSENVLVKGNSVFKFFPFGGYGVFYASFPYPAISFSIWGAEKVRLGDAYDITSISQWGDSEWTVMEGMFANVQRSNGTAYRISAEDTPILSQVTSLADMFRSSGVYFYNNKLRDWDVSHVQNLARMFKNYKFLDVDLGSWDIGNVTDMTEIFSGSSLSQENYDATLIGWAAQEVQRNVIVGADGLTFCEGKAARQKLIDEYGWTFVGDQLAEVCQDETRDPNAFVTVWRTVGNGEYIYLPTRDPVLDYNFTIDWGDGTVEENVNTRPLHQYPAAGEYTVSVTGVFPAIRVSGVYENEDNIVSVEQWGTIKWETFEQAFEANQFTPVPLKINAKDAPDLSGVTNFTTLFKWSGLTDPDLNSWDVSTITHFDQTFFLARSFNGKIDQWNPRNGQVFTNMFYGADSFNQDISGWDMTSAIDLSYMFAETKLFNQPIGNWQFENLVNLNGMFFNAKAFDQSLANWDISKVGSMEGVFDGSGMSQANYDATLIGWASQNVLWDVVVGAEGLTFCAGKAARQKLIDEYRWRFVGDAEASDCKDLITGITFNDATFTYDGTLQTITIIGDLPDGVTVTYENNTRTDVGTQTATAYLDGGGNYENLTLTATLTIVAGESPTAKASDIQVENWEVCSGEVVPLAASSTSVSNPIFTFYLDPALTQKIESAELEVFQDTNVYVTVKGGGINENLPGEAAIIAVKVNLVEAPIFLETTQEFCSEDPPTLDDLVVEPITPGATMEYYASMESTEPLAWNTPLENKTYYAEVYDAVIGCGSARVPISAVVKNCGQEPGEKLPIEGISFDDATFTFDGTEKSILISGNLPTGVSVTYENNSRTEVGSQTATARLNGGETYENLTLTAILTIVEGEVPTAKVSDIQVTGLEVCWGEVIELTAASATITNPVFTFYLDEQLTQKIQEDKIQILEDRQIFVTVKGNGINENLPGEAAVWLIQVLTVEPPVFSLFTQEFCAEAEATLAQVEVQGIGEGQKLNYYESEDSSEPLAMSALLESKTYYAEKVDLNSGCISERVPVVVEVKTCEQVAVDFSVTKVADVTSVLPGGQVSYTITIQNDSDFNTGEILVSDDLDENLEFISSSHNGVLQDGKVVTWAIENIGPGANLQLNLLTKVALDSPVNGVISNVAEGKLVEEPQNVESSNRVDVFVEGIAQTTISIQKTQNVSGEILKGELIEYQISVTNAGNSPAFDLAVEDVFPQDLVLMDASAGAVVESSKVTWYIEELAAGQSVSFTLSFEVIGEQGSLINFASVRGENFPAVSDQTDPVMIQEIPSPDLLIYLESAPEMVLKGQKYLIKLHVVNMGSVRSGPMAVDHYFSDLVGYKGASSEVGEVSYDSNNKYLIWTVDEISPGDTLELILELNANEEGLIENFFQVYSDTPDPDYSNNELVFTINQTELRIPNVFTPNGDGVNETWKIERLQEFFPSNQLLVFDRMGKVVYSVENYQNDWGGAGLARGTYFYELQGTDSQGSTYQFSGFVTIIY